MEPLRPLQHPGGTNKHAVGRVTLEDLVNWYPDPAPPGSSSPMVLRPTPGLTLRATLGNGPVRGMHTLGNTTFVVSGQRLYALSPSYVSIDVGEVLGSGAVRMTHNETHIGIVTSDRAYAATDSSIVELPESGFNGISYQDGYGLFCRSASNEFYIGGVDDMTTIGALDFTTVDAMTGPCMGIASVNHDVVIWKQTSMEMYRNTGAASFPFERLQVVLRGCASANSIAETSGSAFWLGDDRIVYMLNGYQPIPISSNQINELISNADGLAGCRGFVYEQLGHTFYVLTFTDLTVVYDLQTGLWHRRKSSSMDRWRVGSYAKLGTVHLVGDVENGKVYSLEPEVYTDNGDTIRREGVFPPAFMGGNRFFTDELDLQFDPGVGLATGQGSDPQAMLDWSENGGRTWSNEVWADIGAVGEWHRRATWNRLGMSRHRTYRVAVTDPVNATLIGASMRLRGA